MNYLIHFLLAGDDGQAIDASHQTDAKTSPSLFVCSSRSCVQL
jgi:hypothetical protein